MSYEIKPMNIGNVSVDFPVILAPMAGYTDYAFRSLCRRFHSGLSYTEVANAQGLVYGSLPTYHLLETESDERPVAAHIYGSNPESMAKAAVKIEALGKFDLIDINCGCPVRKIVAKGCGSALMKDPPLIKDIVQAVTESVSLPVTVKTRIGLTPEKMNVFEIARAVEDGGASAIAVHARFASVQHNGPADWELLKRIKNELKIPLIGNGGVTSPQDAMDMFEQTGVDAVMIGRAAVGNPWIFDEIYSFFNDLPYSAHSMAEHRKVILEHLKELTRLAELECKFRRKKSLPSEQRAVLHFRAHFFQYLAGMHGRNQTARTLQTMNSPEILIKALDEILERNSEG